MKQIYLVVKDKLCDSMGFEKQKPYSTHSVSVNSELGPVYFVTNEREQVIGVPENWCRNIFKK